MEVIQTSDLTKHYRLGVFKKFNISALEKVSLSVNEGEIFGLLGPNGAGKTTFVKLILSIVSPTHGTATVLGHRLGTRALREQCGYLPESHRYPGFLTALDTLIFFGRLNGIRDSLLKQTAPALLATVGLKDLAKVKTKKFSKGMLQRLGLAQALINDPKILFLDEPTDGVDPIGRKEIRELLLELRAQGKTIFLNSHLLSEVEMISDRVAILNKGQIVKMGSVFELTTQKLSYVLQLSSHLAEGPYAVVKSKFPGLVMDGATLTVTVSEKNELNIIVDLLRSEGIGIESMTQQKASLEDYFIQLVKGENGQ